MWGSEPYWGLGYDWDPRYGCAWTAMFYVAGKLLAQAAEDEAKEPIAR